MLEGEAKLVEENPCHHKVIGWSDSGKAFRIHDVAEFSISILPKYFRTKKFSSFQRNLNLYGFAKVRRGPETDMYAHPSFVRGHPKALLELRKITGGSRQILSSDNSAFNANTSNAAEITRSVSPAFSGTTPVSPRTMVTLEDNITGCNTSSDSSSSSKRRSDVHSLLPVPKSLTLPIPRAERKPNLGNHDRGKLDLLALALEHEFSSGL
jgi:hypothetical protein